MLDDTIAKYLEAFKYACDKKKDDDAKLLDIQLNFNDGRAVSALSKSISFEDAKFYPNQLVVGDRVRRGVNWTHDKQDCFNSIQCEGIVTKVVDNGDKNHVQISWLKNYRDSNSIFDTKNYYYYNTKRTLFRVDINDRNLFPTNVSKPINMTELVRLGDFVTLKNGVFGSWFVEADNDFVDDCLSMVDSEYSRVGVVVDCSENSQKLPDGTSDHVIKVMEIETGNIMKYAMSDLRYADGSGIGNDSLKITAARTIVIQSEVVKPFQKGDRVKLSSKSKELKGCLYKHESGFVGTIVNVDKSTILVNCKSAIHDEKILLAIVGKYPNCHYSSSDLIHEFEGPKYLPLITGDIVELDNSFYQLHKDGWCLGSQEKRKKGIVVYATSSWNQEQRDIDVSSLENLNETYTFRSSWLRRSSVLNEVRHFKAGDRVRLDIGQWSAHANEVSGKCLGSAIFGNYGIVLSEGVLRDGIQRNIEVISCTGDKGQSSFYPSYSLVFASERFAVMTNEDVDSLIKVLKSLLIEASLSAIDVETEVKRYGKMIWHWLGQLPILTSNKIQTAFYAWNSQRSNEWPDDRPLVKSIFRNDSDCLSVEKTWICSNPDCLTFGGFENSVIRVNCKICNFVSPKWACTFCSTRNSVQVNRCVSCCTSKDFDKTILKLFSLARLGSLFDFKELIESDDDIKDILLTVTDSSNNSLLVHAVDARNYDIVHYFFDELHSDGNYQVFGFRTINNLGTSISLIHYIAFRNDYECMNAITKVVDKAVLNEKDVFGWSPLMICSYLRYDKCIKALLQHENIERVLGFHIALFVGDLPIIQLYLKTSDSIIELLTASENECSSLILAVHSGRSDILKELLNYNVDLSITTSDAYAGKTIFATELLNYNFDDSGITTECDDCLTLLHICAHGGFTECLKLLVNKGIDVNATIKYGWTALAICVYYNHVDFLNELLKVSNVDVNVIVTDNTNKQYTPLNIAIMMNRKACIDALLDHSNININQTGVDGFSPLHYCSCYGDKETLVKLLTMPAVAINKTNEDGETPLACACKYGHPAIINSLLNQPGIDLGIKNHIGWTAIDTARLYDHVICLQLLECAEQQSENTKSKSANPKPKVEKKFIFFDNLPSSSSPSPSSSSKTTTSGVSPKIFSLGKASVRNKKKQRKPKWNVPVVKSTMENSSIEVVAMKACGSMNINVYRSPSYDSEIVGMLTRSVQYNFNDNQGSFFKLHPDEYHKIKATGPYPYKSYDPQIEGWCPVNSKDNRFQYLVSMPKSFSAALPTPSLPLLEESSIFTYPLKNLSSDFSSKKQELIKFKDTFIIGSKKVHRVSFSPTCSKGHIMMSLKSEIVCSLCKKTPECDYHCSMCSVTYDLCSKCSVTIIEDNKQLKFQTSPSPTLKKVAKIVKYEKMRKETEIKLENELKYVMHSQHELPDNFEELKNNEIAEEEFSSPKKNQFSGYHFEKSESKCMSPILRKASGDIYNFKPYEPFDDFDRLMRSLDKNGNTCAHYSACARFKKSLSVLLKYGRPNCDLEWLPNANGDTCAGLSDGLLMGCGQDANDFHKIIAYRDLVTKKCILPAIATPFDYEPAPELSDIVLAIKESREDDADYYLNCSNNIHAKLYRSIFRLVFDYGPTIAKQDLEEYVEEIIELSKKQEEVVLDPLYYYVVYLLWKMNPSFAKIQNLRAYDSLKALNKFPKTEKVWLDSSENHVQEMEENSKQDLDAKPCSLEDDDYTDLIPPPAKDDPENIWIKAKKDYNLVSSSMDKLMSMIGLKEVKKKCIDVTLKSLLKPPPDIKNQTSVNFLFVGNPGTGKTTVGTLISQALADLKFRKNPIPVMVSVGDILASSKPLDEFMKNVNNAEGGTLFIDEANLFDPSPKGSRANDSNRVLDALIKVCDTMKLTTTFILAGFKADIDKLLGYNQGFRSRFPKKFEFEFNDYTEIQLTLIISGMIKEKGLRFETMKECGLPIARVLARRLHRGADRHGFSNGRLCEKEIDSCIQNQDGRLIRMKINGIKLKDFDYRVITREDSVGTRPHLEDFEEIKELKNMIGLRLVKENIFNIMNLALTNYDAEMRGDRPQNISLSRLFLGNPGTGKTTVARLFGKILKAFKLLSDGDLISVTPSDLKGVAVGEAADKTRQLLDSAKGKVILIDEAYNLDAKRSASGSFGAEVLNTLVERIDGSPGQDLCIIMAGYQNQMEAMIRNCDNPGLVRRLNLSEAFYFEDFTDDEIKCVLKKQIVNTGLAIEPSCLDFAVKEISKKRCSDGFGNASEAAQILTHAKLKLSARLSKAPVGSIRNMKLLIRDDFCGEETSIQKARDAFAGLLNIDHITSVIDKFEGLVNIAIEEGRLPSSLLADMHMLFLGPPGTGKTTSAKKFASALYQLNVLPTNRFHYTTASALIDRYIGGSGANMKEALERAKGGILFIDEAYGMMPRRHAYGGDLMQVLLDTVTTDEYSGKILVILGGYKHQIEELFSYNPGFQSRFDKIRIEFPAWTPTTSAEALVIAIEREGKTITHEAKESLISYFGCLCDLPNWASARDVMELIKKNLEIERAARSYAQSKQKRQIEEATKPSASVPSAPARGNAAKQAQAAPIPYELEDVTTVFTAVIASRGGNVEKVNSNSFDSAEDNNNVKTVSSKQSLNAMIKSADMDSKLLVLCATDKENCESSRRFDSKFRSIASIMNDCNFVITDDPSIRHSIKISRTPTIRIFYKNQKLGDDIVTDSTDVVINEIRMRLAMVNKMTLNSPPALCSPSSYRPPLPSSDYNPKVAPALPGPSIAPVVTKQKFLINDKTPKNGSDDEEEDINVWAALEEACSELGWSQQQVKSMLENTTDFPPSEILDIIIRSTGCTDTSKIKRMLQPQRQPVLQKVLFSIKESERLKNDKEDKVRCALMKISRCCMGFEFIKVSKGYICAGGSHYCSDDEVNKQINDSSK